MNLSGLGLTDLPDISYYFNHLNSIDLNYNSLTILPSTLGSLPHLKRIYLLGNSHIKKTRSILKTLRSQCINETSPLESIEQELEIWKEDPKASGNKELAAQIILRAFKEKSTTLNLAGLGLTVLPKCIGSLTALQNLNLRDNQFTTVSIPSTLKALQYLYLSNNQLTTLSIPSSLTALQELELFNNRFKTFTLSGACSALKKLDLSNNQLTTFSLSGACSALQELDLSNNQLTTFSLSGMFLALQKLNLSNNQLTTFSLSGTFLALQKINLFLNQLTTFSLSGTFSSLQGINLQHNKLTTFSLTDTCSALQELNISHNELATFSLSGSFLALQKLDLSHNKLTIFCLSCALSALQEINLSYNQIATFSLSGILSALQEINLTCNELTTFSLTDTCSALKKLYLSHNQIATFSLLGTFFALQEIHLSSNKLTTFSLSDTYSALKKLDLSINQLTTFFLSGSCSTLQNLLLNHNQLISLPAEIGNCLSLSHLGIKHNFLLKTLPMSIGEISRLTTSTLDTTNTPIPADMKNSILASCQNKRMEEVSLRLPSQLELWRVYAQIEKTSWPLMSTFNNSEKIAVYEWLVRLARSSDLSHRQQDLAKIVCDILNDASRNSFKEAFLNQIRANNESCQDRAAMALNELYVSWHLLCPQQKLSRKEKLKLLLGAGKTLALRAALGDLLQQRADKRKQEALNKKAALEKRLQQGALCEKEATFEELLQEKTTLEKFLKEKLYVEQEGVEIYLYYEIALREKLGLLTATQSMSYESIGRRDWIDAKALIQEVKNSYIDHIVNLPILDHFLNKDEKAKAKIQEIRAEASEKIDPCPEGPEESKDVLEWNIKQKGIQKELESQLKQFKQTWFKALAKKEGLA